MLTQFSVDVADRLTSHADFLAALKSGFGSLMGAQHIAALTATPTSVDRDFSGRNVNAEMLILNLEYIPQIGVAKPPRSRATGDFRLQPEPLLAT